MLIAINKETKTKKFLANRNYQPGLYTDATWTWLIEAAKEEWECPYCGCEMNLVSFHKENLNTPHWRAKTAHKDSFCEYVEGGLFKKPLSNFRFLKRLNKAGKYSRYIDASVMPVQDFKGKIYKGAVFKIASEDVIVKKTYEKWGQTYALINIGSPFKDGVSLIMLENELPKPNQEMIMCVNDITNTPKETDGKKWILRISYQNQHELFVKKKEVIVNE